MYLSSMRIQLVEDIDSPNRDIDGIVRQAKQINIIYRTFIKYVVAVLTKIMRIDHDDPDAIIFKEI